MAISLIPSLIGSDEIIQNFLQDIVNNSRLSELNKIKRDDIYSAGPIAVYHIDQDTFNEMKSISECSNLVGWRYLFISNQSTLFDMTLVVHNKELIVSSISFDGSLPTSTLEALFTAESDPIIQQYNYELRQINLPWCHFTALWLYRKKNNIFIPLDVTMLYDIITHKIYNEDEIIDRIKIQLK